ncbi:MAG: TIR domain-containing protein [Oscillospiraceae bacterium]|jgi:hypothetical protein|nr:TIR domain-containing protein [Oscillospiraceae bacterium]
MRYDAFISYRHGELDGLVAEKLHKMLETYRIPNAIAKKTGRKKLSRIFRDREELPTSSNLSDSINDALENSDFLLLICSRRTCESQWVMREVERFGELRGKDRIITLLIDGEPDESFPPGLREREVGGETVFVEPLAADIRADTWADSIKLLKEEKLRLLAPILGCAFDDLRRRHRRRRVRRTAAAVGAAFAFTLSFGSFSTWQYIQIDRQMLLKLENQSLVLAEYSGREYADGDPDMAALLALAALPADPDARDRPFVPEAQRALSDALEVYDASNGFKAHRAVTLPSAPVRLILSQDERYAAALYPYELAVIEPESGKILSALPTVRSALADAEFLTESVVVFAGENGLTAYDFDNGETLWQGGLATAVAVSGDGSVIAAVYKDESSAALYNADGSSSGKISFGARAMRVPADDSFLNPRDTLFALDRTGGKLAVSFADGSLSVFDAASGLETVLRQPSNAIWFAGGFFGDALVFSVVEKEPYSAAFIVYDTVSDEILARYESDSAHFTPFIGENALYVAFDDQVMAVNAATGEVSHVTSAGGRVETFSEHSGTLLLCEDESAYRFVSQTEGARIFQSSYVCHFADIGETFALTGSMDSHVIRVLKRTEGTGEILMRYDAAYSFSEAKWDPKAGRAAFYSYAGLRICDAEGNVVAQTAFPDPFDVIDTRYDRINGNLAVLYDSVFLLYSGEDASLLLEKRGKPGVKSVLYTSFGVSVLDENGVVTLYDTSSGEVQISENAKSAVSKNTDCALPIGGGIVSVSDGFVYFGGRELGAGELIGAGETGNGNFAFAIYDGTAGRVFFAQNGELTDGFAFTARGQAEAYFTGGYVFISPLHGDAASYTNDGSPVRTFSENAYMAETGVLGDYIYADYISANSERYALLLTADTLETAACLPGFLGEAENGAIILDGGSGALRAARLLGEGELMAMARKRLSGRTLNREEMTRYKAD